MWCGGSSPAVVVVQYRIFSWSFGVSGVSGMGWDGIGLDWIGFICIGVDLLFAGGSGNVEVWKEVGTWMKVRRRWI